MPEIKIVFKQDGYRLYANGTEIQLDSSISDENLVILTVMQLTVFRKFDMNLREICKEKVEKMSR